LLISCFALFLVRGREFRNLLEMKLPKLRRSSSSSAEAAAAAHDVGIVNAFSSITSHSSILFIFFFFGGTGTGRETTICLLLVPTTGCPSAVVSSLVTIWKFSTIK
jgi:hypothetical protein